MMQRMTCVIVIDMDAMQVNHECGGKGRYRDIRMALKWLIGGQVMDAMGYQMDGTLRDLSRVNLFDDDGRKVGVLKVGSHFKHGGAADEDGEDTEADG